MSDLRGRLLSSHLPIALVLFFSAFFWLVRYPYLGITHDAVVYALLVARELDPSAYTKELLFVFGSQDDFSLFSPVFGRLVSAFGLDLAAKIVVLTGGMLWVTACLALSRAALQRHWLGYFACLILASTVLNYSPNRSTFNVYEHFATARSLAFPLGVLAVAAAVQSRDLLAWAVGLAATLLHPLLGIWALALWVCVRVDERWIAILVLLGFLSVLSGPLWSSGGPLQLMDAEWAEVVRASSIDVFLGSWGQLRLGSILFWLGLLWLGGRYGSPTMRRWYLAMALVCAWAVLISIVCSQFWPIRLVMQAQPWRALWLAEVLGVVAFADVLRAALIFRRTLFWLAIASGVVMWAFGAWLAPWPLLVVFATSLERVRRGGVRMLDWMDAHRKLSLVAAFGLLSVMLPNYLLSLEIAGDAVPMSWGAEFGALRGFFLRGGDGVLFLILAWFLGHGRWRVAAALLIIPATVVAGVRWDIRTKAVRELEAHYLSAGQVPDWVAAWHRAGLQKGDLIAWPGRERAVWFALRTGFYGGPGESGVVMQAVGIVFSRERAIELRRRLERFSLATRLAAAPNGRAAGVPPTGTDAPVSVNLHTIVRGLPTERGVQYLCADPILTWIVADYPTVGGVPGTLFDPGPLNGGRQYFYRCEDVR